VSNDIDVNEHERLSNIALRYKLRYAFIAIVHVYIVTNMSVYRETLITSNLGVKYRGFSILQSENAN
jgi:hypothetical protein